MSSLELKRRRRDPQSTNGGEPKMKLLDRDLETNGRTWLDPRGLDKLMPTGPYNAAAFLIVGPTVIATTGPLMEHLDLLTLAGMDYGQDQWTTDTEFFSPHFSRGTIGLLRGNAGASGVAIEFDVPDRSLCGGSSTGSWFPTSLQRALTCSKRTCANTPVCGPRFLAACSYECISATTAARSTPAVGSM